MIEFMLFGLVGMLVGLRFSAVGAAVFSVAVIAGCVAVAILMNASFEARLISVIVSLLGFNLGLFVGLVQGRHRGGLASAEKKPAHSRLSWARSDL